MLSPRFRINQIRIPITAALVQIGYMAAAVIPSMLELLKKLSGKSVDVSRIPADKLPGALEKKIDKLVIRKIQSVLPNSSGLKYLDIEVSEKHHYTINGWEMVIKIEMGGYGVLFIEPLAALKKTNRPAYTIMRDLLNIIIDSGRYPGLGFHDIVEWLMLDEYAEDENNFEDIDTMKVFQKNLRSAQKKYNRFFQKEKEVIENRTKALRLVHKRIKRMSKDTPVEMITVLKDLLRLACLCCVNVDLKKVEQDTDYSEELNPIYNAFAVLWDPDDEWSEYFFQYMNDQWGNYGAATTLLRVTDKTDVGQICITLRTFMLLQKVWYYIYDLNPAQ